MIHSAHILLIDEDELLAGFIEGALYLHNPAYRVFRAAGLAQALEILDAQRIELVITEVQFSVRADISQFLTGLQKRTPPPMVLALSQGSLANQPVRLRLHGWLSKPPDAAVLLQRVDEMLQLTRDSVLHGISLESFLQVIAHDRKTCTLTVSSGTRSGHLYLANGELVHADTHLLQSKAAALVILSWPDCTIRVSNACPVMRSIEEPLTNLLLDACLYRDRLAHDSTEFSASSPNPPA